MVVAVRPSSKTLDASWTWEDIWEFPEDGNLYEVIDGELYVMTPPLLVHQEISMDISASFYQAARRKRLGRVFTAPVGVKLDEQNLVEPDVVFVSRQKFGSLKRDYIDGPPDIVVEIFSPSTRSKDLNEKAALYARSGVPEYWQIDPRRRSVVVLRLVDGVYIPSPSEDGIARSHVLPGVAIPIASLFNNLA